MNAVETARGDQHLFRFSAKETKEMRVVSTSSANRELVRSFQFDFCASEELSQGSFFRASGAMALMDSVVEGYLATIFAYGQTGSGKTYSMSGIEELLAIAHKKIMEPVTSPFRRDEAHVDLSDGIIPRALKYLFELFEKAPKEVKFVVRASYCEVYNEQVFDLLNPASGALSVRWNDRSGFYVQNLLVVQCDSIDDLMAVVQEGHKNRRVGTHEMNKDSSRSHSIMTVHVDRETTDPNDGHVITKYGKVSFVDLAGSERLKETKSSNTEETSNINKSLLTLGKVISALASKTNTNFIPYRDSKLTKLLMDSLGGNSLMLMVACVSPSSIALEDTLSTLNYATRAKNIQNKPTVQYCGCGYEH
uniref:Kinesin-like protein n=1 Tax=Globisporangium ultimum (strain ATCC 200006 / CBS 805.95 / DAOM BR144) TaxID=431595 RepID=K3WW16_GLOUD